MTEEEKQLVAIEIDKYFRDPFIDSRWFHAHTNLAIERPDEGFEPQSISKIKINQESIEPIVKDIYGFSGRGVVLFRDKASKVGCKAEVEFGGRANTDTKGGRMSVTDIHLTTLHKTTDVIPQ